MADIITPSRTHRSPADHAEHEHHGHPTGWRRYVYSTNHKDIGTMYLVFAIIAGVIGALLSGAMRLELQEPGIQIFHGLAAMVYQTPADAALDAGKHMYNVFTTAHGADHDLLHGHAGDDRRLRQLVRAADDRRAGHGVPAHEQHLVLAAAVRPSRCCCSRCSSRARRAPWASAAAGPSIRRSRPPASPARRWISPSSRSTSPARARSSAPSTSSPPSSTCAPPG